jgi:hypothetical protein
MKPEDDNITHNIPSVMTEIGDTGLDSHSVHTTYESID